LPADHLFVRAHDTSYVGKVQVRPSTEPDLVVGIVGAINRYKGAGIVADMASIIERERLPMRIVVIGTVDGVAPSPSLSITGHYQQEQLPKLLEQNRVSLCLLPSICHETFSFVTSELLGMGMPLASFDLGAPAERIRAHELGCIIREVDARVAIDSLFSFHGRLLGGPSTHRSTDPASP
jgi:glycosyltransferase involved in cell wall biosynthesis